MRILRNVIAVFAITVLTVSCASIPKNPNEVIETSRFGEHVSWLGKYAISVRTQTVKGEPMVIGVFHYLKSKITSLEGVKYPITALDGGDGYFSVGIVFKKKYLDGAIRLNAEYSKIAPFIFVKGEPERILKINGKKVVRLDVEQAWNLGRNKIKVIAMKGLKKSR